MCLNLLLIRAHGKRRDLYVYRTAIELRALTRIYSLTRDASSAANLRLVVASRAIPRAPKNFHCDSLACEKPLALFLQ